MFEKNNKNMLFNTYSKIISPRYRPVMFRFTYKALQLLNIAKKNTHTHIHPNRLIDKNSHAQEEK